MTVGGAAARARSPPRRSCCRRSASRSGRSSKARRTAGKRVGSEDLFNDNNYVPVVAHAHPGDRRGRQDDRVRAQVQRRRSTPTRYDQDTPYIAISSRCAHLGCPVRWVDAAERFICPCHGGVYDLLGRRVGGPPVRPLDRFYTRVNGNREVEARPALQRQQRAAALLAARPRRAAGRHRPVRVPVAPRRAETVGRRRPCPSSPPRRSPPLCRRRRRARARATARPTPLEHAAEAGIDGRRLGRRAHLAERRRALADVPQGAQGHQLVLHARLGHDVRVPLAGRDGRVPGDVLPPRPLRRRLRIDPPRHQRSVPRPVRARHAQVGLERDGDPRVPAHGPHVLLRRLQVPARAQLGDRRGAADPDDGDVVHRLPAAVRPARLLGDDRRREHQRHRARCSGPT